MCQSFFYQIVKAAKIGEDPDYDEIIARYKSEKMSGNWSQDMRIVPVNFNSEHKAMLGHCKMILEDDCGRIVINPDRFDKLITTLRTAVDNYGILDKEATSYNGIFDALRLALKFCLLFELFFVKYPKGLSSSF